MGDPYGVRDKVLGFVASSCLAPEKFGGQSVLPPAALSQKGWVILQSRVLGLTKKKSPKYEEGEHITYFSKVMYLVIKGTLR